MGPKTPPSTLTFRLGFFNNQETVSESIQYGNSDAPWTLASVPANEIEVETSQWHQEQSNGTIHIVRSYNNDVYKIIIDPAHLPSLIDRKLELNLEYKPIQPGERQKAVYRIHKATKDARAWWLRHATYKIRFEHHPEIQPAYRHFARLNGLYEALDRAILIHDISTSTSLVREKFAQTLAILRLSFQIENDSFETDHFLRSILPERTGRDEAQLTSLIRALLEFSNGREDYYQHGFALEYTVLNNADLYAWVLGIRGKRTFGGSKTEEMCNTLSKSPLFLKMEIDLSNLQDWRMKIMKFLPISFPEEYLNLPSRVLHGFRIGHLDLFYAHL